MLGPSRRLNDNNKFDDGCGRGLEARWLREKLGRCFVFGYFSEFLDVFGRFETFLDVFWHLGKTLARCL